MAIKQECGFSLIEVLVAFSIAAVSIAIIFNIYAKGTSAAILGEEYAQAIAIAESRLAQLGVTEQINEAETQGIENDKYQWELEINDHTQQTESDFVSSIILKDVQIEVSWESRGKLRSVILQTLKQEFSQ